MGLLDQVADVLKEYAGSSTHVPSNVNDHFDQVAELAPPNSIAEGIATAFHSNQTPAFGQTLEIPLNPPKNRQSKQYTRRAISSLPARIGTSLKIADLLDLTGGFPRCRGNVLRSWQENGTQVTAHTPMASGGTE